MTLAEKLQRVLLLSSFRVCRSVAECQRSIDSGPSQFMLGYLESLPDNFCRADMDRIDYLWEMAS